MLRRFALATAVTILLLPAIAVPAVTTAKGKAEAAALPAPSAIRQFQMQLALADGTPLVFAIVAPSSDEGRANAAISSAAGRAMAFDRELFAEGGVEAKLSALPAHQPIALPPDAFAMIAKAVSIAAVTGGWYDPAGPSPGSWFTQRDWRRIVLDENARTLTFKSGRMALDLRRLSRGAIADMAMELILQAGFANARVEVGSVCRIAGRDIFTPWSIQVGFGSDASQNAHRAFNYNLTNIAAATVTGDNLGMGLIDPKSKKPVAGKAMRSITVLAADATTATAYALAAWTLGPRMGMRFVEEHPEVKGVLVDSSGRLAASSGLAAANAKADEPLQTAVPDGGPNDLKQKQLEEERDQ